MSVQVKRAPFALFNVVDYLKSNVESLIDSNMATRGTADLYWLRRIVD